MPVLTTKRVPTAALRPSAVREIPAKPAYDRRVPRATPLAARNDTPRVGARVRSLRRERGLTIEQLAAATGLTKGFISQLERDRTAPSLSSIARICDALGVRLSTIFEREPAPALVRKHERPAIESSFATQNHLLSSRDEARFQAIESEVAPGEGAGDELTSLPGEMEFVYVLEGSLELRVGDEVHVLDQGDALTYQLAKAHTWRNASDTETLRVLWVAVPNPY
jgi:transcriptional regulator with XRE-family HTH domain